MLMKCFIIVVLCYGYCVTFLSNLNKKQQLKLAK